MTPELTILAWSVVLLFVLIGFHATLCMFKFGLTPLAGNRDDLPDTSVYIRRAQRTVDNMKEGMMLFAPLVLIAAAAGISNNMTVLGAQIFISARVAHAVLYLAGVPWLRTLVWFASIVGIVMIFLQLVRF